MKIAMACDHGGLELKNTVKAHLEEKGYEVEDFGTYTKESCDYVDFGAKAAKAVASGECEKGIVICSTGICMSICANKVKGIRCALLSDLLSARMTRRHNDANMMAMGQNLTAPTYALEIVDTWLDTPFDGGRHQRRIDKITALENEQ